MKYQEKLNELEGIAEDLIRDLVRIKNKDSQAFTDRLNALRQIDEKLELVKQAQLDEILGPGGEIPAAEPAGPLGHPTR